MVGKDNVVLTRHGGFYSRLTAVDPCHLETRGKGDGNGHRAASKYHVRSRIRMDNWRTMT